jgi:hypothetical protein
MGLQRSNGTRVAHPFPKAHSVSDLGNSSFFTPRVVVAYIVSPLSRRAESGVFPKLDGFFPGAG